MNEIPFQGGPFDGARLTFCDRMPSEILLQYEVLDADLQNLGVQEAISAILGPDPGVVVRNAKAIVAKYSLEQDDDSELWYQYLGWRVTGSDSDDRFKV